MVFKRWYIIAGIVLLLAGTVAQAASLGRVRGTALLGRGLDVSIQVNLDAQEAQPEASCFAVEAFYGDTRVSPNTLSVSPERISNGESRVRIRSSSIVDEPVVTLFVRASCNLSISRRYVLLSEALSEAESGRAVATSPVITLPSVNATPPAAPRSSAGEAASGSRASRNADASSNAAKRRAERAAQRLERQKAQQDAQTEPVPQKTKAARTTTDSKKAAAPRLQVDLLDLTRADISLRGSSELTSLPSVDQAVRSQAQALWRALNATPEEAMREQQRAEALDIQSRATLEQKKRLEADVGRLSADLKTAQDERYVNPLTIFLGLLSLACLALALWAWQRSKVQGQPWWGGKNSAASQDEQHLWGHLVDGTGTQEPLSPKPATKNYSEDQTSPGIRLSRNSGADALSSAPVAVQDKSMSLQAGVLANTNDRLAQNKPPLQAAFELPQSMPQTPSVTQRIGQPSSKRGNSGLGQTDFAASTFSSPRVVAAEELFDIQEQADFFLSLDQPEQAIEVLKNHITENVETSALAYMDLFDIYHRTNRKVDYAELREQFNHVFNAQVPEFESYGAPSRGLEDVPQVLLSIQQVWSMPAQAQDVIQESIFRQPGQKPLDMVAYRELMLLYSLAKELSKPDARFAMLPASMQTASMSSVSDLPDTADFQLDHDLGFPSEQAALLPVSAKPLQMQAIERAIDIDATVKMPVWSEPKDQGVDFDLSDSELSGLNLLPPSSKK